MDIVARDPGLPALAVRAKDKTKLLRTEKQTTELRRQVRVRASRLLDAAVDGTLGINGDAGLTDAVLQEHREARKKRCKQFWKQRRRKIQAQIGRAHV